MRRQQISQRRQSYRRKLKRRALTGLGLIFMFLAGYGGYSLANSSWFNLSQILVEGNQSIPAEELKQLSGVRLGTNLLKIPKSMVEAQIATHPFIKNIQIKRQFPDKLLLKVKERKPLVLACNGATNLVLDEEGACLEILSQMGADQSELPRIIAGDGMQVLLPGDQTEDKGVKAAIALIEQLDPFFMENIQEFRALTEWDLALITRDGLTVYFGPPENLPRKLQYYEELLVKNAAECNAQTLEYLDLRYDTQPVLKRKEIPKK